MFRSDNVFIMILIIKVTSINLLYGEMKFPDILKPWLNPSNNITSN